MSRISPELKERLLAAGKWREFLQAKKDCDVAGLGPAEARRAAVEKVAPELAGLLPSEELVAKRKPKQRKPADAGEASPSVPDAVAADAAAAFAGRTCSDGEAFRWAFTRSQFGDGRMEDAPSEYAWALYTLFGKSPAAMVDISRAVIVKQVAKDDGSDADAGKWDGKEQYDLYEAMKEAGFC